MLFAFDLDSTKSLVNRILDAVAPLFVGVFFALLLKTPVEFFEKTIFKSAKLIKLRRPLALGVTLILVGGFLVAVGFLVVPEITTSVSTLKNSLNGNLFNRIGEKLNLSEKSLQWLKNALKGVLDGIGDKVPELIGVISKTVSGVINGLLGLMIGISLLASKEGDKTDRLLVSLVGEKKRDFLRGTIGSLVEKFSLYLSGSLVEVVIFSMASYLAFLLFKIPYPLLIAVVVGVFNVIPTLGGYIGGGIGALLTFTVAPEKVITFILITFLLQQIEQLTTYPLVVGRYVGLNTFWVLFSVVIGGGLFGFWGLLLGVPVFAFIYNLIFVILKTKTKKAEKELNTT